MAKNKLLLLALLLGNESLVKMRADQREKLKEKEEEKKKKEKKEKKEEVPLEVKEEEVIQ